VPGGLLTDLYELNMADSYLRRSMTGQATFSLFVRKLPPGRGFLVAAGLADCLQFLQDFSFTPDDLGYLRQVRGYGEDTLRAFAGLRFTATSNVAAARRYQLAAAGTMAHSFIEAFGDEQAAFIAFAEDFAGPVTFLVDTYDTGRGVRNAIKVARRLRLPGPVGCGWTPVTWPRWPGWPARCWIRPGWPTPGSSPAAAQTSTRSPPWPPSARRSTRTGWAPRWAFPRMRRTWIAPTSWPPTTGGP